MISPTEPAAMKARPSWPARVAGIGKQIREIRAFEEYRFDPKRMTILKAPTLLLTGSKTASPDLKRAIDVLMTTLPNRSLFVLEGEEHNRWIQSRSSLPKWSRSSCSIPRAKPISSCEA